MLFRIGEQIDGDLSLKIVNRMKSGPGSEIYLAKHRIHEYFFVVKAITKEEERVQQMKNEVKILQNIRYQGIPRVFGYVEEKKRCYMIMSYMEGMNLEEYIARYGVLKEAEVKKIMLGICYLVSQLQNQKFCIIHNDIKPKNVIYNGKGKISIIDFGIAEVYGTDRRNVVFQGTLGYAPPENWHRDIALDTYNTDVFSIGAILFYLLEGGLPRNHYGRFELQEERKRKHWQKVIEKCCNFDVHKRAPNAAFVYKLIQNVEI